jgi:hypothetical protein
VANNYDLSDNVLIALVDWVLNRNALETIIVGSYTQTPSPDAAQCAASILLRSYFGPTHTEPMYTFVAPTFIEKSYQYQDTRRTSLLLSPHSEVEMKA